MELSLPLPYRLVFIGLALVFARSVLGRDLEGAARISGLFVLVGITSTFQGIAAGLGARLATSGSPQEALLAGLALSLGGSIVGFVLTGLAELVLYLAREGGLGSEAPARPRASWLPLPRRLAARRNRA